MNKKKNNSKYIILIGVLLLIGVVGVLIKNNNTNTPANTNNAIQDQPSISNPVQIINGIQEVTLSWGKWNYEPQTIVVKKGIPVKITADLTRLQGCYRSLVIRDFGVSAYFSSGRDSVQFTPDKTGTFRYSCSMGMGTGTLIVEE